MSDTILPESRIFRIGRECYIVYLGKELDDLKPFLRIGNTRNIPDVVHKAVSTTVITDDHVGNPLLEILTVPKFDGRYLGDTAVVGEIRRFFKSFDLPTDEVTDYRTIKDGERRHMVWFYSSGNIHLRYDDKVIFDLDRREKEDGHFVRLYEQAKGEFLRNPLRYIRQDFSGPGIILADKNAFWYEGNEMFSVAAKSGFVAKLMSYGVDPDFISALAYNLTQDHMDSHEAAVYIGFVKRMRQRRKRLRVITSTPELQRKITLLFPARGGVPATLEVSDVSGEKQATFRDSIISRKGDIWQLHRGGLPKVSFNGGGEEDGIAVDIDAGSITVNKASNRTVFTPPMGFPIDFAEGELSLTPIINKYLTYVFNHIKDHLNGGERNAAIALERYVKMLWEDVEANKTSLNSLLKQAAGQARDSVKRCSPREAGPSWFFFANVRSILNLISGRGETGQHLSASADSVAVSLKSLMSRMDHPDVIFPFWGDLYVSDEPLLLWKATKRSFSTMDLGTSSMVNDSIAEIVSPKEIPWRDELERLLKLIRSLEEGGQGPLSGEQLTILARSEEEEQEGKEAESSETSGPRKRGAAERREKAAGEAAKSTTVAGRSEVVRKKKRKRTRRRGWLWISIAVLLLCISALVWDFSGNAPWGRMVPWELMKTADSSVSKDGPDEQDEGNDVAGTPVESIDSDVVPGTLAEPEDDEGIAEQGEDDLAVTETPAETIDPDVAPGTLAEVAAYMDVNGRVLITEVDIHLAANEIAVLNGYKDLDYRVFIGDDPDGIYPGNVLKLPDNDDYTIRTGDTIWFLAARNVRLDVEADLRAYDEAIAILDNPAAGSDERQSAVSLLNEVALDSQSEMMKKMVQNALIEREF